VGDKNTFGKGTVQTILPIGRFTSLLGNRSDDDGELKLTIQKFYRVAGGSTQLHGVASDITLPTLTDLPEFGEGALKNCLPYDKLRKDTRTKERLARHDEEPNIYRLTLDTVDKPNLQLIMYPGKLAEAKAKTGATKVSPEAAPDDDTDTIGAADDTKEPAVDPE